MDTARQQSRDSLLRRITGLCAEADQVRAGFADLLDQGAGRAWERLRAEGRLRPGTSETPPPLSLPESFAEVLSHAVALENAEPDLTPGRGPGLLLRHYLEFMPGLLIEQLCAGDPAASSVFHCQGRGPLDWDRLPHLRRGIDGLFDLFAQAGLSAPPFAPSGAALRKECGTVAALYGRSYYGGFMPLLGGYPGDLSRMGRALLLGEPLEAVIDRDLSAPLLHELSHGSRRRAAIFPPYLDECVSSYLGARVLPALAFPDKNGAGPRTLFAAPWLSQVGQALCRTVGLGAVTRAHAGPKGWEGEAQDALLAAAARLGWAEYARTRDPHFLSSNYRPGPWMKLFFLAVPASAGAGPDLSGLTLESLDAMPWIEVPPGEEAEMDGEILTFALRAMCLRGVREEGAFAVTSLPPVAPIKVDLAGCRVHTTLPPGDAGTEPPSYLFPPAVASRLRGRGVAGYTLEVHDLDALAEAGQAIRDGAPSRHGAGYRLSRHPG